MIDRTASELLQALQTGEITSESLTQQFLQVIRYRDSQIQAFLHVDDDKALQQAKSVDVRRQRGESLGALAGLPVAIKDLLCDKGTPTTCASKILKGFFPPYDAHVTSRLKQADAVLIGRTNLDEFAMGSSTENSGFQITRNPWNVDCVPGGSSGGSTAAVAAGMAPLALGTDTGGSIRQPASFCGVVGLKPTYGRVSRFGLVAFASSLDQVGPIARNVRDCAMLLQVIAGHDSRDSTSVDEPVPGYLDHLDEPPQPLTIGIAKEHFGEGLDPEVEQALRDVMRVYEKLGATIKDVSLPHTRYGIAAYYLISPAEASSNLARYDGMHYGPRTEQTGNLIQKYERTRDEAFGAEVKLRIMLGTYALSSGYRDAYYVKALKVRRLVKNDFDRAFEECDVILGPTAPTPAFKIGEKSDDPLAMYLCDVYTVGANLAGLPGINVPCGFSRAGLPIGAHLLAAPFQEERLLQVASAYERETAWHQRKPNP